VCIDVDKAVVDNKGPLNPMRTMLLGSTFVGLVDVVGVKVGLGLVFFCGRGCGCEGGWVGVGLCMYLYDTFESCA